MRLINVSRFLKNDAALAPATIALSFAAIAPMLGWALAGEHWYLLGLLIAAAAVPVLIRWPILAFGLYALAVPFDSIAVLAEAGGATVTKLLGVLAAAVLIVTGLVGQRLSRPPLLTLWWVLFTAWAGLSALWAINSGVVLDRFPTLLSLLLLYLTAISFRPTQKEVYAVCVMIVLGGAVAASLAYFVGLEASLSSAYSTGRARLVLGDHHSNPNSLGPALAIPLALAVGASVGLRAAVLRAVALATAGLIGLGIYSSISRAAVFSVLLMTAVFVYQLGPRKRVLASLLVLVAVLAAMPERFYDRISSALTGVDYTGSGRTEIWKTGAEMLENFWLLGAGLDHFPLVYSFFRLEGPAGQGAGAHNIFLMVWVELGIVGLALMLLAVGCHLRAASRYHHFGSARLLLTTIEAACVGMLALSFFGDELYRKAFWLSWILLGWVVSLADPPGSSSRHASHTVTDGALSLPSTTAGMHP